MKIQSLPRKYLSFTELTKKWQCSETDLAHFVANGELKPSVWFDGLQPITEWNCDEATGQMMPNRHITNAEFHYRVEPVGWRYLQAPRQFGANECGFIFASRDREPKWPIASENGPYSRWYFLPTDHGMKEVKENAIFLVEEIAMFERTHAAPEQCELAYCPLANRRLSPRREGELKGLPSAFENRRSNNRRGC